MLRLARVSAVVIGVGTVAFLFILGNVRADNLFLVPDLLFSAVLVTAALLPDRLARPALVLGFALAAGVLITSVSSYNVRGELGTFSLIGLVPSVVLAIALSRRRSGT